MYKRQECGTALIEKELEEEGIVPYCPKCQQYRFPMYNVAVSMIVVDEETGKILLIQQYGKDVYKRQALPYPLRPFGEQKKYHIAALAHDVPRLSPPRVGFFQEEIRGHADPDLLTTLDFVVSGAVFLERVGKAAFRFVDLGSVLVPYPVEKIHVAVLATLAALDAAVPWIPDVVQEAHLLSVPIIMVGQVGNKSVPCTAPQDVIG